MNMYKEFEEKYPLLFRNKDEREPINLFGIECRSGWKSLLNNAFQLMYGTYKHELRTYQYWTAQQASESTSQQKINDNQNIYANKLIEAESQLPIIAQIKEKFGTLRLYCDNVNDYVRGIIDLAEAMSAETCEVCGSRGNCVGGKWVQTLCRECSQPHQPK